MEPLERAARWCLWRVHGVGYRGMMRLVAQCEGDLASLFRCSGRAQRDALAAIGAREPVAARILEVLQRQNPLAEHQYELSMLPHGAQILALGDAGYPQALYDLAAPPVFLYVRGDVGSLGAPRRVAVVGSRQARVDGITLAHRMGSDLGGAEVVVVSGGALGIDAAAHAGCLEAGAPTVAVLAAGVDRPTPRRNERLFERIHVQGALISEYPLGVKPRSYHFHRRNELIAALGHATVVVRAGLSSGTLITARAAAQLGRALCAVPGAPDDALAAGCNQLLVDGAWCVRDARDVLARVYVCPEPQAQLNLLAPPRAPRQPVRAPVARAERRAPAIDALSEDARAIYSLLTTLSTPAACEVARDDLKRQSDWPESRISPALLELELSGVIEKVAGANAFRPATG